MKAPEIFDVCHSRYRALRERVKDDHAQIRSVPFDAPCVGYQWRPERVRACEFVADFERIGRYALRRPEWKGRLKLFEAYFLDGAEYRRAIALVGVAEGTFDYWFREVKRTVGAEFSRPGLFPPSRYFQLAKEPRSEQRSENAPPGLGGQSAGREEANKHVSI